MVTARDREVADLSERQSALATEIDALVAAAAQPGGQAAAELALAAGTASAAGPGLTVTLDDADLAPDALGADPAPSEDRLVHQQDLDAVINALWAGGAEVLAVQGQRVTSATRIKCVGNVILVGGRVYSPPYQIDAIGPIEAMRERLDRSPMVHAYRERADRIGLVWGTVDQVELTIAGDTRASSALRYAKVAGLAAGFENPRAP
jgi:uncharacterized protein YlxW (UPF0749 family)